MGVSRSPRELNAKLQRLGKAMETSKDRKSISPVADQVKRVMLSTAAQAGLHTGSKIAGKPWRGVYVRGEGANDLAVGYAFPAILLDRGARSHFIVARGHQRGGNLRRQYRKGGLQLKHQAMQLAVASLFGGTVGQGIHTALNIKGVGLRAYAHHPGIKGKRFFARALPLAQREGAKAYETTVKNTLARALAA